LAIENACYELDNIKKEKVKEIMQADFNKETAEQQFKVAESQLRYSEEISRYTLSKFETEKVSIMDFQIVHNSI
jgi:hypothetical protein